METAAGAKRPREEEADTENEPATNVEIEDERLFLPNIEVSVPHEGSESGHVAGYPFPEPGVENPEQLHEDHDLQNNVENVSPTTEGISKVSQEPGAPTGADREAEGEPTDSLDLVDPSHRSRCEQLVLQTMNQSIRDNFPSFFWHVTDPGELGLTISLRGPSDALKKCGPLPPCCEKMMVVDERHPSGVAARAGLRKNDILFWVRSTTLSSSFSELRRSGLPYRPLTFWVINDPQASSVDWLERKINVTSKRPFKVEQWENMNRMVKRFLSIEEASKWSGVSKQHIWDGLRRGYAADGYFWKYALTDSDAVAAAHATASTSTTTSNPPASSFSGGASAPRKHFASNLKVVLGDNREPLQVEQWDTERMIATFGSIYEAHRKTRIDIKCIRDGLRRNYRSAGYYWKVGGIPKEFALPSIRQTSKPARGSRVSSLCHSPRPPLRNSFASQNQARPVEQYDGIVLVQTFSSATKASEQTGIPKKTIYDGIRRGYRGGGYYWRFAEVNPAAATSTTTSTRATTGSATAIPVSSASSASNRGSLVKPHQTVKGPIEQWLGETHIHTFNSLAQGVDRTGIDRLTIIESIQQGVIGGGFSWKGRLVTMQPTVEQLDSEQQAVIRTFSSVYQAQSCVNASRQEIMKALQSGLPAGGYYWRYGEPKV